MLDMGDAGEDRRLARTMVRLFRARSARRHAIPDGDIAIEYVGLRDGEKLYEELLIGEAMWHDRASAHSAQPGTLFVPKAKLEPMR